MRPYERRETAAYPFFKLATWDARSMVWRAGKVTTRAEKDATAMARTKGRYRVERFDESGSVALEPFEV